MARGVDRRGKEIEMAGFAVIGSFQGFTRQRTADSLWHSVHLYESCLHFAFILKNLCEWYQSHPIYIVCEEVYVLLVTIFNNRNASFTVTYSSVMKSFVFPLSCVTVWQFINKRGSFMCIYFYLIKISLFQWKYVSHVNVTLKVCVVTGCMCVEKINNCWSRNMQGMENVVTAVEWCCDPFVCK